MEVQLTDGDGEWEWPRWRKGRWQRCRRRASVVWTGSLQNLFVRWSSEPSCRPHPDLPGTIPFLGHLIDYVHVLQAFPHLKALIRIIHHGWHARRWERAVNRRSARHPGARLLVKDEDGCPPVCKCLPSLSHFRSFGLQMPGPLSFAADGPLSQSSPFRQIVWVSF